MHVYVIRDSAGNVRGVASEVPSGLPPSNWYEDFELDVCLNCGIVHFDASDDASCRE